MIVPDGLVFASAPVLLAASAKAGQWFVQDVISHNKKTSRTNTSAPMTLADFELIADLMKRELNGRYMFATEAREKFAALEKQIEEHAREMKAFMVDLAKAQTRGDI